MTEPCHLVALNIKDTYCNTSNKLQTYSGSPTIRARRHVAALQQQRQRHTQQGNTSSTRELPGLELGHARFAREVGDNLTKKMENYKGEFGNFYFDLSVEISQASCPAASRGS